MSSRNKLNQIYMLVESVFSEAAFGLIVVLFLHLKNFELI